LRPAEEAALQDLDPAVFGVIVEDANSSRRGLLLPDIPGVESAEQQVDIAARKAGIPQGTPIRLWRFKVDRFREAETN
jgi:AMMECR1 domain-containing protein